MDLSSIISRDPRFHALQRRRGRFAWSLAAVVLACFYGFILIIAFRPALFAIALYPGTVVTTGIAYGLGLIVLSILLTGFFVWRANHEFDPCNQDLLDEASKNLPR